MIRNLYLITAALVLLISSSNLVRAGEINVNWRTQIDSYKIWDLKFMPGKNNFIVSADDKTQIRKCDDGSIVSEFPFGANRMEFSSDSSKLILIEGKSKPTGRIQIRDVNSMDLLHEYILPPDDSGVPDVNVYFTDLAVDPIRPLFYVIHEKIRINAIPQFQASKIMIFSTETLQPIGELTTIEDNSLTLINLAVSKDGKYLAAMNGGKAKLMVWSLDSRTKIVDKYISDPSNDKFSEPTDLKFSEINTDKIYFSGIFYQRFDIPAFGGLCIYSISENKIIDSTFALPPYLFGGSSHFTLFENETKVIASYDHLRIFDLINKSIEFDKEFTLNDDIYAVESIYNQENRYFVGFDGGKKLNKFSYHPNTEVSNKKIDEIIYPNPTTGIISIPNACINASRYEICNSTGRLINSINLTNAPHGNLSLDFTQYPVGVYYVKVYCGNQVSQFQIIKEG